MVSEDFILENKNKNRWGKARGRQEWRQIPSEAAPIYKVSSVDVKRVSNVYFALESV